ncbi:hypothetical protein AAFF_G00052690 [Aldrovandia affinis]|uniref:SCAN box domain-containing protein n=1 Tax=Aldrovandia affinis TaxID=143900 RepID=A0AAD7T4T6_9TELE|nr:hypothetical protein AAFF_G00052690 [Aldrovandia affinis]
MDEEQSDMYTDLKEALLRKFDINPEIYHLQFQSITTPPGETPRETYDHLKGLYHRWMHPEIHSKEEISHQPSYHSNPTRGRETWDNRDKPVIGTPFQWIAMDIVGPLEKSSLGHDFVLVVCDYTPRFPEAFPLCSTKMPQLIKLATIATPLINLTSKAACNPVKWTEECEQAFVTLKTHLCTQPILKSPDFEDCFLVQVDASGRDKNSRVTRWYLALQPYKFRIQHKAGKQNLIADYLSRIPDLVVSGEGGN